MSEHLWDFYRRKLNERITTHAAFLAAGKCTSYEQYKEVTGKIAGLKEALAELKETIRKVGLDNEQDD